MKSLISAVLAVFLTLTVVTPAQAKLSSGDRDKIAIGVGIVGLAWLFGDRSDNGDEVIVLERNCRYAWDERNCRKQNGISRVWERNTEMYLKALLDYQQADNDIFNLSAQLAEQKVYAQNDKSSSMKRKIRGLETDIKRAEAAQNRATKQMQNAAQRMNDNLNDYQKFGGDVNRLKAWAQQRQEQMEDFDPTIAPWEQ